MRKALSVWNPFAELERIRKEFDRLFDEVTTVESERVFAPVVDIYETDSELVIKAEVPGAKKEDIEVSIKDNAVHIKGEKKEEKEEKTETVHRVERFYGKFERFIPLPTDVKVDEAKAEYKDGVLEIRIPKSEASKEKRIKIS